MRPAPLVIAALAAGCSTAPQPLVFSEWAESVQPMAACITALKAQLRDPDSYQDDWARPTPQIDAAARTVTYRWSFRAKNGFGGYNAGEAECTNTLPEGSTDVFGQARARVIE